MPYPASLSAAAATFTDALANLGKYLRLSGEPSVTIVRKVAAANAPIETLDGTRERFEAAAVVLVRKRLIPTASTGMKLHERYK